MDLTRASLKRIFSFGKLDAAESDDSQRSHYSAAGGVALKRIFSFGKLDDNDDSLSSRRSHFSAPPGQLPLPATSGVVALDFDGTLAARGVAHSDLQHGIVSHCFGGAERVASLTAWLERLKADGATLAVVSRNSQRIVRACLGEVGWLGLFGEHLYGREDIERHSMLKGRKSVLIRKLLIEPFGLRAEDVLFVDDDEANCDDVEKRLGAAVLLVTGREGLVASELLRVSQWVAQRAALAAAGHVAARGTVLLPDSVAMAAQAGMHAGTGTMRAAEAHAALPMRRSCTSLGLSSMAS